MKDLDGAAALEFTHAAVHAAIGAGVENQSLKEKLCVECFLKNKDWLWKIDMFLTHLDVRLAGFKCKCNEMMYVCL